MIDIRHRGRVIAVAYLLFCIVYLGAPVVAIGVVHPLAPSFIDAAIPFLPWTIAVYLSQFAFMFLALWLSPDSESLKNILVSLTIATALSVTIFIAWPTTILRPNVHNLAFATLYLFDVPTNCFPSLHVALAMIAAAMWPRRSTRVLAWLWATAITLSTLTTKQHMAIDITGGIVIAVIALAWSSAIDRRVARVTATR